jgi:hypothetical protein
LSSASASPASASPRCSIKPRKARALRSLLRTMVASYLERPGRLGFRARRQAHFTTAARPTENGFVESFHGRFRDECLNTEIFADLDDAKRKVDAWRPEYNRRRPTRPLAISHRKSTSNAGKRRSVRRSEFRDPSCPNFQTDHIVQWRHGRKNHTFGGRHRTTVWADFLRWRRALACITNRGSSNEPLSNE